MISLHQDYRIRGIGDEAMARILAKAYRKEVYEEVMLQNAIRMDVQDYDFLVIHVPQPRGLGVPQTPTSRSTSENSSLPSGH